MCDPTPSGRVYESNRNLLASITGKYGTASKATFAYAHDALGRRTSVVQTGENFSRYSGGGLVNVYEYNDRSELIAGQSYHGTNAADWSYPVAGRGFGYAFDNIGNRTSSTVIGTDASDVRTTNYTSNQLNQVTVRDAPASTDVTGLAPTNASVTVNSAAATRQGDFFFKNVAAGSRPLWQAITSVSTLSGTPTTDTRYSFVPAASEAMAYDADGNLTSDGRWTYTWDAENRLRSMETASPGVFSHGGTHDARRIDFAYDYLGRRGSDPTGSGRRSLEKWQRAIRR